MSDARMEAVLQQMMEDGNAKNLDTSYSEEMLNEIRSTFKKSDSTTREELIRALEALQLSTKSGVYSSTDNAADAAASISTRQEQTDMWNNGIKWMQSGEIDLGISLLMRSWMVAGQGPGIMPADLAFAKDVLYEHSQKSLDAKILSAIFMLTDRDLNKAGRQLDKCIRLADADNQVNDFVRIGLYMIRSAVHIMRDLVMPSLDDLNTAIELIERQDHDKQSRLLEALINRVKLKRGQHEHRSAITDANRALKLTSEAPSNEQRPELMYLLSSMYADIGDVPAAKGYFSQASKWKQQYGKMHISDGIASLEKECEMNLIRFGSTKVKDRACSQCGITVTGTPKRCGRCHASVYCGRECQKKAWRTHKRTCAVERSNIEAAKKIAGNDNGAPKLPPASVKSPDADHRGNLILKEGGAALKAKDYAKAAERFCYALFLDFSLDAKLGSAGHLETLAKHIAAGTNVYADILVRLVHIKKITLSILDSFVIELTRTYKSSSMAKAELDWAIAVAAVIVGRMFARLASSLGDASLNSKALKWIVYAYRLIGDRGYLAMLFDMGWAYRDLVDFKNARVYFKEYLKRAPRNHFFRAFAQQNISMMDMSGR